MTYGAIIEFSRGFLRKNTKNYVDFGSREVYETVMKRNKKRITEVKAPATPEDFAEFTGSESFDGLPVTKLRF